MSSWLSESPRIDAELWRATRTTPPSLLHDTGLVIAHRDARRLLERIDRLEKRVRRAGWLAKLLSRVVVVLTVLAFLVLMLPRFGILVDDRLGEIAHVEVSVGFAYAVFELISHRIRRRRLRVLQEW